MSHLLLSFVDGFSEPLLVLLSVVVCDCFRHRIFNLVNDLKRNIVSCYVTKCEFKIWPRRVGEEASVETSMGYYF